MRNAGRIRSVAYVSAVLETTTKTLKGEDGVAHMPQSQWSMSLPVAVLFLGMEGPALLHLAPLLPCTMYVTATAQIVICVLHKTSYPSIFSLQCTPMPKPDISRLLSKARDPSDFFPMMLISPQFTLTQQSN